MSNFRNNRLVRSRAGRTSSLVLVLVGAIAGMLVANAALASSKHGSGHRAVAHKSGLAVFTHHPKGLARIAQANSVIAPKGAILAAVIGRNEVYALRKTSGDDCVLDLTVGAGGGSVCSSASQAEEAGIVGIFQEGEGATAPGSPATLQVAAILPDGVSSVRFTDRDGSSYRVPVTNNVAEREDVNIASVSYTLPSGGSQFTDVAGVVDHAPSQPGSAGSSRTASN